MLVLLITIIQTLRSSFTRVKPKPLGPYHPRRVRDSSPLWYTSHQHWTRTIHDIPEKSGWPGHRILGGNGRDSCGNR